MSLWSKLKEIMPRPKNPRIKALENKISKLEDQLNNDKDMVDDTIPKLPDDSEIMKTKYENSTSFTFEIDEQGNYLAIQMHPVRAEYKLGDSQVRAEFELKKLLAHGILLPKKGK